MDVWNILLVILTSSFSAAIITGLFRILERKLGWKHAEHMIRDKEIKAFSDALEIMKQANRVILHDRIKYLARCALEIGFISFDDRRDLVEMHGIYHNQLGGNGHLDLLMAEVAKLPFTEKRSNNHE